MKEKIVVKGARTHNLKNLSVEIPRNKMVVFTGVSGSGKSSLAFDTIFAEGQRRYVESLSPYARQFLQQFQKPEVEEITGLSPAISIDQKARSSNPRSTVATITEIYDYLRILYARIGKPYCLICGSEISKLSNEEIKNFIFKKITEYKKKDLIDINIEIVAPVVRGRKGEYYQLLYDLLSAGYSDVYIDGVKKKLRERIVMAKNKKHNVEVVVDVIAFDDFSEDPRSAEERLSESLEKALEEADGLVKIIFDNNENKEKNDEFIMSSNLSCPNDGYSYPEIEPRLFSFNSPYGACPECNGLGTRHFFGDEPCPECKGARLRKEALNVLINKTNISQLVGHSIIETLEFFDKAKLTSREKEISKIIIREIRDRLDFMYNVGIEYLTLDRRANTLSGGEAQRIRLASQLGSGLVGALYVLDEPTIGLHSRDNERLIKTLHNLRDLGNSIIIVEHDENTIYASDFLVDIGPGAGVHGGEIVASDYLDKLLKSPNDSGSVTVDYLKGDKMIRVPQSRRIREKGSLKVRGGKIYNIKNLNVDVPLGRFNVVTGVSGSGKSSFVYEILYKNLQGRFDRRYRTNEIFNATTFTGTEYVSRAVMIDQSPIGRTPRSNPATYTGAYTHIRDMFASTSEARARGWKPGRFSFNVKGGRCEVCEGKGKIAVEMHFLPTVYIDCDTCGGKRFTKETLEIKYRKKNIHEVLKMTIEEALVFFEDIPAISDRLQTLFDVGLGYLELGQSATTLSGGEAQRVKISAELYKMHIHKTIYILDEPTIGLHYEDVKKLIEILQKLVDKGNTVLVIEHNMDIIKNADYIIDIGPEGGEAGGKLVAKGTPEEVSMSKTSYTAKFLREALKKK
jgi:excinuclease ABC subunit A